MRGQSKKHSVLKDRICIANFNESSKDSRAGTLVLSSFIPTSPYPDRPEITSGAGGDGFASLRSARRTPEPNKCYRPIHQHERQIIAIRSPPPSVNAPSLQQNYNVMHQVNFGR